MSRLFSDFKMTFSYGVSFCCLLISKYGFFYDVVMTKRYLALQVYILYRARLIRSAEVSNAYVSVAILTFK